MNEQELVIHRVHAGLGSMVMQSMVDSFFLLHASFRSILFCVRAGWGSMVWFLGRANLGSIVWGSMVDSFFWVHAVGGSVNR